MEHSPVCQQTGEVRNLFIHSWV